MPTRATQPRGHRWFLGPDVVALLPSRGVSHASGLEPPPHLVGERARALDILAAGGLVCASAAALAEGMPPPAARPRPVRLVVGEEPGLDGLAEALASAGYERVDRVEERGQFAVRGGIVDVFPSTGREPLRVELFGDEIEQVRAFSPFTQRALHTVTEASVYPAAERRGESIDPEPWRIDWEDESDPSASALPTDLVAAIDRPPDFVWQPDDVRAVWEEEGLTPISLEGATELDPFPRGQAFQFEAQRPAIAARGLAEAENELAGFVRSGNRVVVTFPHRGEALRQGGLLRKVESTIHPDGAALPREATVRFAVSPARRGFVWRELGLVLLPDTQVFRKRPPRADARLGRALASFADLRVGDYVVHEDHGVGKLLGFETKSRRRRHPRLSVPRVPRRGQALRSARAARQALPLYRRRREVTDALEARRQGVAEPQDQGARVRARARRRASRALRAAATGRRRQLRPLERVAGTARGFVPVPRDRRPGTCDRGRQGRPRVDEADGQARLR